MSQFLKLLLPAVLVVSLIVACQKQDAIHQPTTAKTNLAAMARTDNKDYRIHGDTAAAWATRFKQLNSTKMGNKMPGVITLPNNGILQLQAEAAAHGVQLSSIAMHLSVKEDGSIGVFYTPVGMDGNEIRDYGGETISGYRYFETYDGSGCLCCPGSPCVTADASSSLK